ncbi:MAG TPA: sigma-70 family RNA polymerase sigma factor [Acidimicrobiia bacterium]|nr:sigma-70 family RNA polymerase sigma factor [Acidimicrobiia bacterium]
MAEVERQDQEVQIPGRFEAFYREEYPAVVALVYGLTGSAWSAEDLAQEAFLRAHNDWTRVGTMAARSAWVRRVALNLAVSRYRRLRAEAAAKVRLRPDVTSLQPPTAESQAFWREVRRLPRRQSQVLVLRYIDELSVAEIAKILQIADGTVKALMHQARTRLARQLAAKGWVDDET